MPHTKQSNDTKRRFLRLVTADEMETEVVILNKSLEDAVSLPLEVINEQRKLYHEAGELKGLTKVPLNRIFTSDLSDEQKYLLCFGQFDQFLNQRPPK